MIITTVFMLIFVIVVAAVISASRFEKQWHHYCVSCERPVDEKSSFCNNCGANHDGWQGIRRLVSKKDGVKRYEHLILRVVVKIK